MWIQLQSLYEVYSRTEQEHTSTVIDLGARSVLGALRFRGNLERLGHEVCGALYFCKPL